MKTITVKLPESLAIWLFRRTIELGRPQSEIIGELLQYVECRLFTLDSDFEHYRRYEHPVTPLLFPA